MSARFLLPLVAVVLLLAGAAAAAKPKPAVKVLGNDRALLESPAGDVLACLPGRDDAGRAQMACGIVDFRSGAVLAVVPNTYYVQIQQDGLTVLKSGALEEGQRVFRGPEPKRRPTFGPFAMRAAGKTLDLRAGARFGFAGTSVGCAVSKAADAVTCVLVDAAFRPVPRSLGFKIGFRSLQVLRVDAAGKSKVSITRRHGS